MITHLSISVFNVFPLIGIVHLGKIADHGKLCTINPIGGSCVLYQFKKISPKALDHLVSEFITKDLVDLGKLTDPHNGHIHLLVTDQIGLQILKKTVLVAKTGEKINMPLNSVIPDHTRKVIRLIIQIQKYCSTTGTDIKYSVLPNRTVLHVVT